MRINVFLLVKRISLCGVLILLARPAFTATVNDGIPLEWREAYFGTNNVDSSQAAATADPMAMGAATTRSSWLAPIRWIPCPTT
jgi:hypothetical protein